MLLSAVPAAPGPAVLLRGSAALDDITRFDAQPPAAVSTGDADALYADRESAASASAAVEIWAARMAVNPRDFESAWKLARGYYWLGTNGRDSDERKAALEAGVSAGRTAAQARGDRPEGHFWLAANMGALAESFGVRQGLKYRGPIREALEKVLAIDPAFQKGSADRALGRWYFKVPRLFGGDRNTSEAHLRKALAYDENSVVTHLFLAETLEALGRREEAREQLRAALSAPVDPEWAPEDRRFKQQAETLLRKLGK